MASSTLKATFPYDIQTVWDIVTTLENYAWRSDLSKISILNETQFVEYTKEGFATTFTITACKVCKRWEFDMENDNMKGHWVGNFTSEEGSTTIEFTENVNAKKLFMKPFVGIYLKKQQETYVRDLGKVLESI